MDIISHIQNIENTLIEVFNQVDTWFDASEEIQNYRPQNQGWTIREILEHIELTSHFLLILIDKGAKKALNTVHKLDFEKVIENYQFQKDKLDEVGIHLSFKWIRPEHMDPKGEKNLDEIRTGIKNQLERCLTHLKNMPNGEGILYKTTMTVNNLGKIDVYEYIYFLAKHAERHLTQMEKNKIEFFTLNGIE